MINCPYDDQARLGTNFYRENSLGKIIDVVVPSKEAYLTNRSRCAILTAKTTLRERWQEVVEELTRTNVPHLYLLTIDEVISGSVMETLAQHNITVILFDSVKESKFPDFDNVKGYETFFNHEIPHALSYWTDK